jgi:hypothetical protein
MACDGCGGARFELSDTFAATRGGGAVEVAVWTCRGCGDRVEEEAGAPGPDVEPMSSVA